jgi:peptide/nickel transport system substrate-binding protein
MFRRKTLAAIAAAAAIALGVSACGGSSTPGGTSSTPASSTLTLGLILPAATFSAQDMEFANQSPYGQAVYDNLLRADPSGKVIPSLATDWKYNADKTELDMTLRSDVTFTDGTKLDADAAAQNLKRFRDGASPNKSFLVNLKDATAVDATHLKLTLTQSDPGLLNYLTQNAGMIEAPSAFTKSDIKTNPIGSGPYVLDTAKTVIGTSYEFSKNPNYWNKADQHYDRLVLKVFNDPTSMLNAVKGNQLNGAKLANNDALDQIKSAGYSLVSWEGDWTGLILFDRDGKLNPALKDVRVRQAINYAMDRASLLTAVGKGHGTVTTQIFPKSSVGYDDSYNSIYTYDVAKAKSLLADAGFPNGFTLDMPSTSLAAPATFTIIGQQLKDIGITVNFTDTGNNFIADLLTPKYAASFMALQMDPDWQLVNFELTPTATFNPTKYADPKVDAFVKQYHDATSDADAATALKGLNKYIVEQAWFAPWYRVESNYATDSKTTVVPQVGNAYPYLWNFVPKS